MKTTQIAQHVSYFMGLNGEDHCFVAVMDSESIEIVKPLDASLFVRSDFCGIVGKHPKTGWTGTVPTTNGNLYLPETPDRLHAIMRVRKEAKEARDYAGRLQDPVFALEEALKLHDWNYSYSDDHRTWRAGEASWRYITVLSKKVDAATFDALVSRYKPKAA